MWDPQIHVHMWLEQPSNIAATISDD